MDEQTFKDTVTRLKAVDAVVKDLDSGLRDEAVRILTPYITGEPVAASKKMHTRQDTGDMREKPPPNPAKEGASGDLDLDLDEMVEKHQSDKDHENLLLAVAVYYDRHGKGPVAIKDIKSIGEEEMMLDLPTRPDVTLKTLKRDQQVVMRKGSDGLWKVTPTGEKWLRATFGVTKGRRAAPEA